MKPWPQKWLAIKSAVVTGKMVLDKRLRRNLRNAMVNLVMLNPHKYWMKQWKGGHSLKSPSCLNRTLVN